MSSGLINYDPDGNIIATKGLVLVYPWRIHESNAFPGRHYFFNPHTNKNAWVLPPNYVVIDESVRVEYTSAPSPIPRHQKLVVRAGQQSRSADQYMKSSNVLSLSPRLSAHASTSSVDHHLSLPLVISDDRKKILIGNFQASSHFEADTTKKILPATAKTMKDESSAILSPLLSLSSSNTSSKFSRNVILAGFPLYHDRAPPNKGISKRLDSVPFKVVGGLGNGSFATVVEVVHESGVHFAMKVAKKSRALKFRDQEHLNIELKIMSEIPPSPFLQRCHTAFESPSSVFFIIDLLKGGDLFTHLERRLDLSGDGFTEDEGRILLSEVVLGIEHLHSNGFIHRDIKVENIMLDAHGHIKIIDFGMAIHFQDDEESPMTILGTLSYLSPEMISEHKGGRHTDWWALGVLAHELLTGKSPWSSLKDAKVIREEILSKDITIPPNISLEAGNFICALLCRNYRKRLGFDSDTEIRSSEFFKSVDWDLTLRQLNVPAFEIDTTKSVNFKDAQQAIRCYLGLKPSPLRWNLGLDFIDSDPESII